MNRNEKLTRRRKLTALVSSAALAFTLSALVGGASAAAPTSPVDQTKVPHYFGPYPNWANSPLAVHDASVTISGDGSGAKAEATVGANGSITGITVTDPGHGYSNASVALGGSGTGAAASAHIISRGNLASIAVRKAGLGYREPVVRFRDIPRAGLPSTGSGAAATAYGGVERIRLTNQGRGYTFPTVDFDLPNDPHGVKATGHALKDANGSITSVVLDNPGSGYSKAPGIKIIDGTQFSPATHDPATFIEATATATLSISSVVLTNFGSGYTKPPAMIIADRGGKGGTGRGALVAGTVEKGTIDSISVTNPGSGYISSSGIRKFVDTLPGLTPAGVNDLGQYLPVAQADTDDIREHGLLRDRGRPAQREDAQGSARDAATRVRPAFDTAS